MKLRVIVCMVSVLLASSFINFSYSQVSELTNLERSPISTHGVKVYQHIKDEFDKHFAGAENVKWSRLDEDFLAHFSILDQKYAVLFSRRADIKYRIVYGKENHLPVDIRRWVKRVYLEFNIAAAVRVQESGRDIWLVNVVDDTEFAWVKIENDEVKEVERYKKFKPKIAPRPALARK